MILPADDIAALTGYVRPSAQSRWLRKQGWKHLVNSAGQPVVAFEEFKRHLVGGSRVSTMVQDVILDSIND